MLIDVKLGTLLLKITEQLGVNYRIDTYGIVFVSRLEDRAEVVFTRRYPLRDEPIASEDPMEALQELGVAFRGGATAYVIDDGSELVVRKTPAELDRVDHYMNNIEPLHLERMVPMSPFGGIVNPIFSSLDIP